MIVGGITVILFSAGLDVFYAGTPGFGHDQLSGIAVGVIVALAGLRKVVLPKRTILDGVILVAYLAGVLFTGLKPSNYELAGVNEMLSMDSFSLLDFAINFLGFLPLGYLMISYVVADNRMPKKAHVIGLIVACGLGISLVLETVQYLLVLGRFSSLYDCLANGAGTLGGICLYLFARQWDTRVSQAMPPISYKTGKTAVRV